MSKRRNKNMKAGPVKLILPNEPVTPTEPAKQAKPEKPEKPEKPGKHAKPARLAKRAARVVDASASVATPEIEDLYDIPEIHDAHDVPVVLEMPIDEAPIDETPVVWPSFDEAPIDEAPFDEAPIDETPIDEVSVDEAPVDAAMADAMPADELPADELPVDENPGNEIVADEIPAVEIVEMDMQSTREPEVVRDVPARDVHEFDDASGALAEATEIDPSTITSKARQFESIPIVASQGAAMELGEQGMDADGAEPHAPGIWGSMGAATDGTAVTFDLVEDQAAEPAAVDEPGKKGKKPDRKLKLNKLQKHARSAPAPEPEVVPEPVVEPRAPRIPRAPRMPAFAKLTEYQQLSLAHVPGLPEETDVPGHWRGVGFGLGGRRLVSGFDEVVEIMRMPQITHVPGTQPWMLGVANVRGTLLPVVDLKQFLEGERTVMHEGQRVLVVRQSGGNVAVLIDQLYGQRSFNDSQKTRTAEDESRYGYFIKQMYRVGDNDWGVFSMSMLTRTPEFRQAAA